MAIVSMIVQPAAGLESGVTKLLSELGGVTVQAVSPRQEIILLIEAASLDVVKEIAGVIETTPGVLGVFPAYITTADETTAV